MVVTVKKDVAFLSQRLQRILLGIHQYRVRIIYKPGPCLFIADWLSRQKHKGNKVEKMTGMQVNINIIQKTTKHPRMHDDT